MECHNALTTNTHWYVIQTKPRQEAVAEENLRRQSFDVYLPRIKEPRRNRGKWVDRIQPLFPRYLFARLDLEHDNVAPVRSTYGVTALVTFGGQINPLPHGFVEELQTASDPLSGLHQPNQPLFHRGDAVTIVSGPLTGYQGIFQAATSEERVIILLDMLGRTNTVRLKHDSIAPSRYLA